MQSVDVQFCNRGSNTPNTDLGGAGVIHKAMRICFVARRSDRFCLGSGFLYTATRHCNSRLARLQRPGDHLCRPQAPLTSYEIQVAREVYGFQGPRNYGCNHFCPGRFPGDPDILLHHASGRLPDHLPQVCTTHVTIRYRTGSQQVLGQDYWSNRRASNRAQSLQHTPEPDYYRLVYTHSIGLLRVDRCHELVTCQYTDIRT